MADNKKIENVKVVPTEKIVIDEEDNFEDEMRELTRDELLYRLKHEETDPEKMKIIKNILKTKA